QNMGGYDIFYSQNINGEWSKPVNIGYPINTTDHDLFFVPHEDGKFAYSSEYSNYGYGLADIYLYQLFHIPESNRVKIEGILTMDNPDNRNREDFVIHITDTINNDTIATLYPDKDKGEYQYRTAHGKDHLVWEGESKKGNQYFISKEYTIKEVFLEPVKPKEPRELAVEDSEPEIKIENKKYRVTSDDEKVKIKLSLQKGNKLFVDTYSKDKLINSEEFDINNDEFIYEYKPLKGETKLKFRLADKNNHIKTEEVTVSYTPADTEAELAIIEQLVSLNSGNKNVKIKLLVEKNSRLSVETYVKNKRINKEHFDVKKDEFIYELEPKADTTRLLFKLIDKHQNVKNEEILIFHKPVNKAFEKILNNLASFDSKSLNQIATSEDIKLSRTIEELVSNFYSKTAKAGISQQNTKAMITALAINATENTNSFVADLAKIATGGLKVVLDSAMTHKLVFNSNLEVISYLKKQSAAYHYSYKDIATLLETYLKDSDFEVGYLINILAELTRVDFNDILSKLDSSALDITTIEDLKTHLKQQNIYNKKQLEQIYSIIEGLALNQPGETDLPEKEEATTPTTEKNHWVLLTSIIISFIVLGVIIVFFNRRKKNRGRKR
ncbi:MAG: hypothetical protein ACQESQ_08155, partial [Bacteroidota bacterium]